MGHKRPSVWVWLAPMLLTIVFTSVLMLGGRLGDLLFMPGGPVSLFKGWLVVENPQVAREVILAVLEVLAAVFAISITVVAIIVQLSATRYTSRVVDLFLAEPFNIFIFFAYVVPLIYGFWLSNTLQGGENLGFSVGLFMVMATLSITLVIPYFKFVFHFLQPRHIIDRIERSIESSLHEAAAGTGGLERPRSEVSNSIRQLSDIALSSIAQSDIVLAMQCIRSMRQALVYYLPLKQELPEAWYRVEPHQIVGLSEDLWRETVEKRNWLELEVFKQYEIAFTSSLRKVRDINAFTARCVREIAVAAAQSGREESLELLIKGMNTFVMYTLSERDIRTAVNVLYQYRLLAESLLERPELLAQIAGYLRYYGENSQRRRIFFILEVIAYDLRMLIERAAAKRADAGEAVLEAFLALAQNGEGREERAFRGGLCKTRVLLGAFFVRNGQFQLAKRIHDALAGEERDLLLQVREDLLTTETRDFWEIEDRGVSFYYVEKENRESIDQFIGWLLGESPLPDEIARSA